MPNLKFKEPTEFDYLHIDSSGRVHLIFPIVGGDEIASDNTCKTAYELKSFFYGSSGHPSALAQLSDYRDKLQEDIAAIQQQKSVGASAYAEILKAKQERLRQINEYIPMVKRLAESPAIRNEMMGSFPRVPEGVHKLLKDAKNAFAVHLAPEVEDSYTRFENPAYVANRANVLYGRTDVGLGAELRKGLLKTTIKPNSRDGVVETVTKEIKAQNIDISTLMTINGEPSTAQKETFEKIRAILLAELQKIEPTVSLDKSNYGDQAITLAYVHAVLMPDDETKPEDWVNNIIDNALTAEFWPKDSLFYTVSGPLERFDSRGNSLDQQPQVDAMSIKVQFLLAEAALFCRTNNISKDNFAAFFDKPEQSKAIVTAVETALSKGESVEDALFKYINDHQVDLGMSQKLTKEQQEEITERFNNHYNIIKESPHFDEFFILDPAQKGNVYSHRGRISCHFLEFFAHETGQDLAQVCKASGMDGYPAALESEVSSNRLNHKNPIVDQHNKVEKINTEAMKLWKRDPEQLLEFLLKTPENGVPNIKFLSTESRSAIVFDRRFPELQQLMAASTNPNIGLLEKALDRADLNRGNRVEVAWNQFSTKPFPELDLQKIAENLKDTVQSYKQKRSVSWWKGSPSAAREQQMEQLDAVQKEMHAVLNADPFDREKAVEVVQKSYAVLDKIDKEISKEWNFFSSTLQQEVRACKQQLNNICLPNADFPYGENIRTSATKAINAQIDSIKNSAVRDIVYQLPAHCQTTHAIDLFKQLDQQQAVKVAAYLQMEYRPVTEPLDKDDLLTNIIPTAFKDVNDGVLESVKDDIPKETFEALEAMTSSIPPQHFHADNVRTWGINVEAVETSPLKGLLTEVAKIDAILKAGGTHTQKQISQMVDLVQGMENAKRENFRELAQLPTAVRETLTAFEVRVKQVELEPKDTRILTQSIKGELRGLTQDDTPTEGLKNV